MKKAVMITSLILCVFIVAVGCTILDNDTVEVIKPVIEDELVGQGVILNFIIRMTDTQETQQKLYIMEVEGDFVWGNNLTVSFIIDNETILMDNRGETGLTDLRPGQMVKLWVRDDNPYLLETGAHLASQVLVMSAPEEVSLWLEDEQRKTITTLTNIVLTDWQQTNDDAQKISLQKVNNRFFIAELIPEGMNHWESGLFYLFDTKEKNLRQLPFGGKLIKRYQVVMLEGHTLTLLVENFAQIHGHQIFPHLLRYNVLTGNYTEQPYYASLYEEFTLGGKHKMALRAIETNNHGNIFFRYELIEGTELVGGLHTPTVHIPSILSARGMFEEENVFTVDLENVYLTDAVYDSMETLKYHSNISNVYFKEYTDAFDKNHVVIFFALENATAYTTGFIEREDTISDFYIMFR